MKYEIRPVVDIDELKKALELQYGPDFMDDYELRIFLFADEYANDCYKSYFFGNLEEFTGKIWQDEEYIRKENCIKTFLQDCFPNHTRVLINMGC